MTWVATSDGANSWVNVGPRDSCLRYGYVHDGTFLLRLKYAAPHPTNPEGVAEWLFDGQGLALSIWGEGMTTDLGDGAYPPRIMTLARWT